MRTSGPIDGYSLWNLVDWTLRALWAQSFLGWELELSLSLALRALAHYSFGSSRSIEERR